MEAPTLIANRRVCAVCGAPQPEGGAVCPNDGSSIFTSPSLAFDTTLPAQLSKRDPVVGMRLGDYEVEQIIGEGGMGIVYRGLQPVIQKRVAIKVLRPEVSGDPALVKRFLAEAQAVNAIGHRNIIDIFTLGQLADGRPYIVMEFLDGTPLDQYLKQRAPLPPLEAVELLIDIVAPLQAAHAAGVIHRDLKPSNVFLVKQTDGTRYLKLLDFGLAKKAHEGHSAQTSSSMVTGTPDYMSPEQARGADVSPRSDLYSLGVMAFEMLSGAIPFTGATPMDVLIKHVHEPAPTLSSRIEGVSPAFEALVTSLMEKNANARMAPADRVRTELKRIQKELMMGATRIGIPLPPEVPRPLATPADMPAELPGPPPRTGLLWWGALFVTLALVGAAATAFVLKKPAHVEPFVVALPPPVAVEKKPPPVAVAVAEPEPEPEVEPELESSPVVEPRGKPPVIRKPVNRPKADASSLDALSDRITRLETRMKKNVEPGEEPDPAAMVLLKKIKVSLVTSHTQEERLEVKKSLDSWESTFLRK